MASAAIDLQRGYAPVSWQPDVGIDQALAAARRLVGATGIDLIAYDREGGTASSIASSSDVSPTPVSPDLLVSMEAETAFLLREPVPRWMKVRDAQADDSLLVKLAAQSTSTLFLLVSLADLSGMARARVVRLVPDLVTLVRFHVGLTTRMREMEEMRDAAAEALDHGECGVIALRADRSVVFANSAASTYLAGDTGLRLRRGVVRPADRASAARFDAALDAVLESEGEEGARLRPRAKIMLLDSGKTDLRPTIIAIAPVTAAIEQHGEVRGAAAIVYILRPAQGTVRGLDTLCQLHGLSRVESQMIAHMMGGLTLSETAAEMRIKGETARTYLKQIFAKTGIHRQADLMALMTRYLRAVRGDFDFQPA